MIYERRWNKTILGKEKKFLEERVKVFITFLEKYGGRFYAGIFTPRLAEEINEVWYIMEYDSLAHREQVYNDIRADAEYWKLDASWYKDPCLITEGVQILERTDPKPVDMKFTKVE